jgi:NUDIX domain
VLCCYTRITPSKSHTFINAVVLSPATRWILFKNGEPLLISDHGTRKLALAYLTTDDVLPLLGSPPFFGQGECEGQIAGSDESLAAACHRGIPIVFLGLNQHNPATASVMAFSASDIKCLQAAIASLDGTPYFALDVGDLELGTVDAMLTNAKSVKDGDGEKLVWVDARSAIARLDRSNSIVNFLLLIQKKFSGNSYSALAGFVEPGETFEGAVQREMWEETGVKVWDVRYHSTQSWVRLFILTIQRTP